MAENVWGIILLTIFAVRGSTTPVVNQGEIRRTDTENAYFLSCAEGYITYVNVTSGKDNKNVAKSCRGKSASLMQQENECYWSQNCTIQLPTDVIIKSKDVEDDGGESSCIGELPDYILVSAVRCFTNTSKQYPAIDICDQKNLAYQDTLIRSHIGYPWIYHIHEPTCSLSLYAEINSRMVITVQEIDIGEDDSLRILTGSSTINLTSGHSETLSDSTDHAVLEFLVDKDSNGGKGFIICLKHAKITDYVSNACDAVTRPGSVTKITKKTENPMTFLSTIQFTYEETVTPKPCKRRKKKQCGPKKDKHVKDKNRKRNDAGKDGKKRRKRQRKKRRHIKY